MVTHNTVPLVFQVKNNYEHICLDIMELGKYPVILGIPWLVTHNPIINWKTHSIKFPVPSKLSLSSQDIPISICTTNNKNTQVVPESNTQVTLKKDLQVTPVKVTIPVEYSSYVDVFDKDMSEILPPHHPYDHQIPLMPNTAPPYGPIYSLSEPELKVLKEYIDENLAYGFIYHSSSPAGAPILFVKKKDGSLWLCADYHGLNKITIKNHYPLPLINELIDYLCTAKIFTKIDLCRAYNLVCIAPGEEWKTAFHTRYGHYEFQVMPFSLCNAPASFQHFMNDVLSDYLDQFAIVYLDDILIFSPTYESHVTHVKKVLNRLRTNSLFTKLEKCCFHQDKVEFLGFIVSHEGVIMDDAKVSAITSWPTPHNVKDIQSFLGLANFYHHFIKGFSKVVTPLTCLTKDKVPWNWDEKAQSSFDTLKSCFTTAPILHYFDPTKPITVETDASDYAIGAVLSQPDNNNVLHPIAYYSKKFSPAEINYEIYDKEMFAIVSAFKEWHAYLEGAHYQVTVLTDHKNLEYFTTTKTLNRHQAHWSETLGNYDFVIKYIPGKKNGKPDAAILLPRLPS